MRSRDELLICSYHIFLIKYFSITKLTCFWWLVNFFFIIMVLNWILYFVFVHGCLPRTICSELLVLSGSCLLEHGQTGHTLHMQVEAITYTSRNETYQWRR